ncbi:outer membrane protein assembly factor BamA [bacterium]|nr:outer membrane protein assembly factor BamA [bacterium]
MKKILLSFFLILTTALVSQEIPKDSYENVQVGEIIVNITNHPPSEKETKTEVLTQMQIKVGDNFSQTEFDKELKSLSKKYQVVEPVITKKEGKLVIQLNVTLRPTIVKFMVTGSSYGASKILNKGNLSAPMVYNRGKFYESLMDIRDFLIKRGYFKADVAYKINDIPGTNEATAEIIIDQGPLGHIHDIKMQGFTRKERRQLYSMLKSSRFNILTNWLTGSGVIKEKEQQEDEQRITHFIQNEGYIDAKVQMEIKEVEKDKLTLYITLDRGEIYRFGNVEVQGNTLESTKTVEKALSLKEGESFSTEKIYHAQEKLKSLYTKQGYLDTNVSYKLSPGKDHTYNVVFEVAESDKYKVGLVMISGNTRTNNNVIYNFADIAPGEEFDSRKIKIAQRRLQATGHFKNVSVYGVKGDELEMKHDASKYRNVMIEVEENRTGSFHLSAGANSTANLFGELSISESNFDLHGLSTMWTEGINALRGGGQFLDLKAMVAAKDKTLTLKWNNPYINDSLWTLGIDGQGRKDNTIGSYTLWSVGGGIRASYPINSYMSGGIKTRLKNSIVDLGDADVKTDERRKSNLNNGITAAGGFVLNYNSTDNPYVPSRGLKSSFETEFVGLVRDQEFIQDFPFFKFGFNNSFYYPLWNGATFKIRGDANLIYTMWNGRALDLPLTEKFFLGGVETLRGYAPGQLGPQFVQDELGNPQGGVTSFLGSVELLQKVLPILDVFTFFDAGSLSDLKFNVFREPNRIFDKFYLSTGAGIRLHMGQPLPFVIGYGYAINPDPYRGEGTNPEIQRVFFSMAGQF